MKILLLIASILFCSFIDNPKKKVEVPITHDFEYYSNRVKTDSIFRKNNGSPLFVRGRIGFLDCDSTHMFIRYTVIEEQ